MSLVEQLLGAAGASTAGAERDGRDASLRFLGAGVVIGVVTNIQDPDNLGRVRLKFPWLSEDGESEWARVATLMAGKGRGCVFLPEVDDEVLVAFEHGDMRRPFVIGALWNGVDVLPPEFVNDGRNNLRLIRSRSGHLIKLDDTEGGERIEVIDKTGKNTIVIDSQANTITITAGQDLRLEAPQGKLSLNAQELELKSGTTVMVEAGSQMTLQAAAAMNLAGATINLN
jgi:uncharacterized protein involved in type VI secretion and phage assembly